VLSLKISDSIESFIRDLLEAQTSVELKRNELASYFNCVPSQINYVIQTRFTTERGFMVESRRGGGGYVKITRVELGNNDMIEHILGSLGRSVDIMTIEAILNSLYVNNIIGSAEAKIIMTACSNNALSAIPDGPMKNRVRADIFKNLLLLFV
jgi:transcriptional regulator CtsR